VRAGGASGSRNQLIEEALLGNHVEAVAEPDGRVACDERREAMPALLRPRVAIVEALDELGDKHLGVGTRGRDRNRRAT
jgi:hypothetical protein